MAKAPDPMNAPPPRYRIVRRNIEVCNGHMRWSEMRCHAHRCVNPPMGFDLRMR